MFQKGSKKSIRAWAFYDWANSVYSLVISTAVFPIYFESITSQNQGSISLFGFDFEPTALYSYSLSFSFFLVAFMSPILSGIADYTGSKKKFMQFFCYLGGISVMMLFFFDSIDTVWIGFIFSVLASIGFWSSIVFYNSFLPEVAYPDQQDAASAKGFMFGYIGSLFLLGFNLFMIMSPDTFGIESSTLPSRISFLMVGLWWIGFAQVTFSKLPDNVHHRKPNRDFILKGWNELRLVLNEIKTQRSLKLLLISFFFMSIGVQTIILLASVFGAKELGLGTTDLIITIMMVQVWGILGAYAFSRFSMRFGNLKALKTTIVFWTLACFSAYFLNEEDPNLIFKFYGLGALIGISLGAIQSLARSSYSKLIPETTKDLATYFSFFDVTEKIAIVFGTFIFGLVVALTGSMRASILILAIFFVLAFAVLSQIKREEKLS
jgi:UMF1 family MFS transporter